VCTISACNLQNVHASVSIRHYARHSLYVRSWIEWHVRFSRRTGASWLWQAQNTVLATPHTAQRQITLGPGYITDDGTYSVAVGCLSRYSPHDVMLTQSWRNSVKWRLLVTVLCVWIWNVSWCYNHVLISNLFTHTLVTRNVFFKNNCRCLFTCCTPWQGCFNDIFDIVYFVEFPITIDAI